MLHETDWPQLVLTAASLHEPFDEVRITTLLSVFEKKAYAEAQLRLQRGGAPVNAHTVKQLAKVLVRQGQIEVRESVTVTGEKISAAINTRNLKDDEVTWQALKMVAETLDQLDGESGVIEFGEPVKFPITSLHLLMTP